MKIPLFSKLVASKPRGRKVVRASAARAMRAEEEDFYESEPNMKLSHAFMVVLVLHVVAVGGIYAFNKVSANKNANLVSDISGRLSRATGGSAAAAPAAEAKPEAPAQKLPGDADEPLPIVQATGPVVSTVPPAPAAAAKPDAKPSAPAVAAAKADAKPAAKGEAPKAAAAKPAADAKPAAEAKAGAATYKVAKGDSPYTIAKKLNVSQEELLSLNGISDPKKLQIGQVLKVPGKSH